jgi:hypothetical protein
MNPWYDEFLKVPVRIRAFAIPVRVAALDGKNVILPAKWQHLEAAKVRPKIVSGPDSLHFLGRLNGRHKQDMHPDELDLCLSAYTVSMLLNKTETLELCLELFLILTAKPFCFDKDDVGVSRKEKIDVLLIPADQPRLAFVFVQHYLFSGTVLAVRIDVHGTSKPIDMIIGEPTSVVCRQRSYSYKLTNLVAELLIETCFMPKRGANE